MFGGGNKPGGMDPSTFGKGDSIFAGAAATGGMQFMPMQGGGFQQPPGLKPKIGDTTNLFGPPKKAKPANNDDSDGDGLFAGGDRR